MNIKRCLTYGCTEPAKPKANRCILHDAEFQAARKERRKKRYDAAYRAERKRWAEFYAQGGVTACARCKGKVDYSTGFHLDHVDSRLPGITGGPQLIPSHSTCNTSAGGKLGKRRKKV